MWDTKRQVIWLLTGIAFGTFIIYNEAHDETGHLDPTIFTFWETILLIIISAMFYIYSRQGRG